MQSISVRMRGWLYLSILPMLLVGFSAHHASVRHGSAIHARIPHRAVRNSSRTGEACLVDYASGDTQHTGAVSLHVHGDHPRQPVFSFAALPVVFSAVFHPVFILLRGAPPGLDVLSPVFSPATSRGPPLSSLI